MTAPAQIAPILPSLRFRARHVQQTIAAYVADQMASLGWVNDPVNFGGTAMTFIESPPEETGNSTAVPPNTVAISLGDEPDELEEQLGGGLYTVMYPVYVDIYGESYSGVRSIAQDVKDILTRKYLQVYDFALAPPEPVVGAWIEFENVSGPRTPSAAMNAEGFRKYWRVVFAQALTSFSDLPGPGETQNPVNLVAASAGSASAHATLFRRTPVSPSTAHGVAAVAGDLSVAAGGTPPVLPTDAYANAPSLVGLTGSVVVDTTAATNTDPKDAGINGSHSVWMKYTCTVGGPAQVDTIGTTDGHGSNCDTYLAVLRDDGGIVVGDDDGGGLLTSKCIWQALPGVSYHFRISDLNGTGTPDMHFNWNVPG